MVAIGSVVAMKSESRTIMGSIVIAHLIVTSGRVSVTANEWPQ
jgi:hypothetical protein